MTIVMGLRCRDGIVLASDSQRTEGRLRETIPKLFVSRAGIVWGCAGSLAIQQELYVELDHLSLPFQPDRGATREQLVGAVLNSVRRATAAIESPSSVSLQLDGVFAWHSATEGRNYLLRVSGNGHAEFALRYTAVGGPRDLALFALSQSEHLGYAKLPLEAGKMLVADIADAVVRSSAGGVGHPLQMAVVTATQGTVLDAAERRGLEDSVAAFREHQRNFLAGGDAAGDGADTGLRP